MGRARRLWTACTCELATGRGEHGDEYRHRKRARDVEGDGEHELLDLRAEWRDTLNMGWREAWGLMVRHSAWVVLVPMRGHGTET